MPVVSFLISSVSAFFRAFGGRCCRFHPSCSVYANEAFRSQNFWKALKLSVLRVLRCNPISPGGFDPLPKGDY